VDQVPCVLVVDDDKQLLQLVNILLKRIKCRTELVEDGNSALRWLEAPERLDLVILDLMLPDLDGFDILRRIRSRPDFEKVPVLILSAKADPTTIRNGIDYGADGYITKPYLANNLIARVQALLNMGRAN